MYINLIFSNGYLLCLTATLLWCLCIWIWRVLAVSCFPLALCCGMDVWGYEYGEVLDKWGTELEGKEHQVLELVTWALSKHSLCKDPHHLWGLELGIRALPSGSHLNRRGLYDNTPPGAHTDQLLGPQDLPFSSLPSEDPGFPISWCAYIWTPLCLWLQIYWSSSFIVWKCLSSFSSCTWLAFML